MNNEELCLSCTNRFLYIGEYQIYYCSACDSEDEGAIEYFDKCMNDEIPDWICPCYFNKNRR